MTRSRSCVAPRTPQISSTGTASLMCSWVRKSWHRREEPARLTGSSMGLSSIPMGSIPSTRFAGRDRVAFAAMPDPLSDRVNVAAVLDLAAKEAKAYLAGIDDALVRPQGSEAIRDMELPEQGVGALAALTELIDAAVEGSTRSAGPRFFHFVMGGGTPAALGADWITSALDQSAYNWVSSAFASRLEQITIGWLKDLFGLPAAWGGVITTGATMANFAGLAAARRWWGLEQGVDVEADGLSGLPPMTILSSGYMHVSATKAIAVLGLGRQRARTLSRDAIGRIDLAAVAPDLRDHGSEPRVIIPDPGD